MKLLYTVYCCIDALSVDMWDGKESKRTFFR